jgi:integrase/recombinase XerD
MEITIAELRNHLAVHNYSKSTIAHYPYQVEKLCQFCNKQPHEINEIDFKEFTEHLVHNTNLSWNTIHQFHGGISFFFRVFLKNTAYTKYVKYPRRQKKLPVILSVAEIRNIFEHVTDLKHSTILKLFYSTGMRLGELRRLTIECIDFERRTIKINGGKGRKDRYVNISNVMYAQLKEYLEIYNPTSFLFESEKAKTLYSEAGIRHILFRAKKDLRIQKKISIHSLRHAFATHMIEQGGNILTLQKLLGHESLNATMIYLHTQNTDISRGPNPLDNLDLF